MLTDCTRIIQILSHHQLPVEERHVEDDKEQQLSHNQLSCVRGTEYNFQILFRIMNGGFGFEMRNVYKLDKNDIL